MDSQRLFFNTHAAGWEEKLYPQKVRQRLEKLIPEFRVQKGTRVLDVGTGTGVLYPYLKRAVREEGRILAFDISENMLREAVKKDRADQDLFFQADALSIPLCKGAMDQVICFAAFPHFSDMQAGISEMARVLKPGGRLSIAHLMSREELARHHGSRHSVVARDVLPQESKMKTLFLNAGLEPPEITDIPGRYLASSIKRGDHEA